MHEWIKKRRPISNPNANFTSSLMRWWKRIHTPVSHNCCLSRFCFDDAVADTGNTG